MVSLQLVDEKKVKSLGEICATPNFLYVINSAKKKDFAVAAREGAELWPDKTTINLACGKKSVALVAMHDDIFAVSDKSLFKIRGKEIISKAIEPPVERSDIFLSYYKWHPYKYFDIGSDGNCLYVELNTDDGSAFRSHYLVINSDLELINAFRSEEDEDGSRIIDGQSVLFLSDNWHEWKVYTQGILKEKMARPLWYPDEVYDELAKFEKERDADPERNADPGLSSLEALNKHIESCGRLDNLLYHFTDGTNLYALSRKGRIVGCAQDSLVLLDEFGHELNENRAIDCAHNGKYAVVVHDDHARIFSSGKMVGKSDVDTSGIKDMTMDDRFVYLLRKDCRIQRYSIID